MTGVRAANPEPVPSGRPQETPVQGVLASGWVLRVDGVSAPGPCPAVGTGSESGMTSEGVRRDDGDAHTGDGKRVIPTEAEESETVIPHHRSSLRPKPREETDNRHTPFSYVGAPAAAGMNDWHENSVAIPRFVLPAEAGIHGGVIRGRTSVRPAGGQPEAAAPGPRPTVGTGSGSGMTSEGVRQDDGDAHTGDSKRVIPTEAEESETVIPHHRSLLRPKPREETANRHTPFSYIGAPAAAGMNDWHENSVASLHFVLPAEAGIHGGVIRGRTSVRPAGGQPEAAAPLPRPTVGTGSGSGMTSEGVRQDECGNPARRLG